MESKKGRIIDFQDKLIKACRKKDRRAQLKIYNLYSKAMYNVCLNIVNNEYEAEDLMQEAFISAFQKIEFFSEKVTFGAWLKKITINKCIDYLKKKKLSFENLDNHSNYSEPVNTDDGILYKETVESIKQQIMELADGYRTILCLHLFEGFDHDEIAQILGIAPSTSRSQYTRAKALLIKTLKEKK